MNGTSPSVLQDGYYLVAKIEGGIVKPLQITTSAQNDPVVEEKPEPVWCGLDGFAASKRRKVSEFLEYARKPEYAEFFKHQYGFWYVRSDFQIPQNDDATAPSDAVQSGNDAVTWMMLSAFAKLHGMSKDTLQTRTRTVSYREYFKKENGHWLVRADMPIIKTPGYRSIRVVCKETGKEYPSIVEACRDTGISIGAVQKSLKTGKKCGGYHFTYAT